MLLGADCAIWSASWQAADPVAPLAAACCHNHLLYHPLYICQTICFLHMQARHPTMMYSSTQGPEVARGTTPQPQPSDCALPNGVFAREQPDGRHCLFGEPLRHAPKLLRRIFRMRQQPGQLLWASEQPLEAEAWQYLQDVFAAPRIRPLLMRGQRVLKPLPGQ